MWYCEVFTSGYFALISLKRSSQKGMVIAMPLDLVAEVTCFFLRVRASSKANFMMRSVPLREKIDSCVANSSGVPPYMRPPTDEYSPSLFSRTTQKSMSPGLRLARGDGTPGMRRTGRRFTYWWKPRRIGIRSPHSDTWSGTPGKPTAPRKMESWLRICSSPSLGIISPCFA